MVRLETQIAVGHDSDELRSVDHRHSGDVVLARELDHLADARPRRYSDGVGDDAALVFLDGANLPRLLLRGHVLVDNADSAGLRDADCEPCLGDRVHRRRHERNVQADFAGQPRGQLGVAGEHLGVSGYQEDVVERERLLHLEHRMRLLAGLRG